MTILLADVEISSVHSEQDHQGWGERPQSSNFAKRWPEHMKSIQRICSYLLKSPHSFCVLLNLRFIKEFLIDDQKSRKTRQESPWTLNLKESLNNYTSCSQKDIYEQLIYIFSSRARRPSSPLLFWSTASPHMLYFPVCWAARSAELVYTRCYLAQGYFLIFQEQLCKVLSVQLSKCILEDYSCFLAYRRPAS